MFVIPHLVKAIRRILKRSAAPELVTLPVPPSVLSAPPVLRVIPTPNRTSQPADEAPTDFLPIPPELVDEKGPRKVGDCMDEFMRELHLRRTHPLVRVDEEPSAKNGYAIGLVFADREHGGFEYDFYCKDPLNALSWVCHMAEKSWVTKDHLELFAQIAIERFTEPRKAA